MKVTVINGTPIKGVTNYMKESFLSHLRDGNEIVEYYPKDFPPFCLGCKNCFLRGEDKCPHLNSHGVIWDSIISSDLIVFCYPVYALRVPASIKSLLDHWCVHWTVHRPCPEMFHKRAVIITNSVGAPNGSAQKDVMTSLHWMGLSRVYRIGMGMMGDILIASLTDSHKKKIQRITKKAALKVKDKKPSSICR